MKITIIYDNETWKEGLKADWGFSCLIEIYNRKILFDTGANGSILLNNMKKLNIDPLEIEEVFISHSHWDHTGGLEDFLRINPTKVYVPLSCQEPHGATEVIKIKEPLEIHENIFSTGELRNIEQSLAVKTEKGLIVIAGCSHPGVKNILKAASEFGNPVGLIGGLHGFRDFDLVRDLKLICPTHCTQFKSEIKSRYPDKYIEGGAGKVIEI
ncbi:MAG: MBL fold metallo-hydrolase [Candidatus Aenigmarchaeota archaeon]|nr:MBL fold metallo-hydrolase [Candidatus Aenigmarchaeota archaeon]